MRALKGVVDLSSADCARTLRNREMSTLEGFPAREAQAETAQGLDREQLRSPDIPDKAFPFRVVSRDMREALRRQGCGSLKLCLRDE